MDGAALFTNHGALRQRNVLHMPTATHALGGRLKSRHLPEQAAVLLAHPLLLEQIVRKPEIAYLAAPERFHAGQVEILESQCVKASRQIMRCLPGTNMPERRIRIAMNITLANGQGAR